MNKKILIVISIIIIIMFVCFIYFNNNKKETDIKGFEYFSGSSSISIEFKGNKEGEELNVISEYFDSGEKEINTFTISFNEFKELLNMTKIDDCKKHTYDYQCGEFDGCTYSSFYVYLKTGKKICYEINNNVSDYFKNINVINK